MEGLARGLLFPLGLGDVDGAGSVGSFGDCLQLSRVRMSARIVVLVGVAIPDCVGDTCCPEPGVVGRFENQIGEFEVGVID